MDSFLRYFIVDSFIVDFLFKIQCVVYTFSTVQFRLGIFQVLNSPPQLVATILDSTALETSFGLKFSGQCPCTGLLV